MLASQLFQIACAVDGLEVRLGKAPAPTFTEEELELVSDWGRAGQGVGGKATPQMIADLIEVGKKLPKKKVPTLYRGMCFPEGTLYARGEYTRDGIVYPEGFVEHPAGINYRSDPAFYKRITTGPRSWSTKLSSAKYYGGHSSKNRDWKSPECLIVQWLNPPQDAVLLDTRVLTGLGYSLATDTDEVLADAKGASVGEPTYDKFLMLTIQG